MRRRNPMSQISLIAVAGSEIECGRLRLNFILSMTMGPIGQLPKLIRARLTCAITDLTWIILTSNLRDAEARDCPRQ